MHIEILDGTYIVAVSGGVDSVVLLHMLATKSQYKSHRFVVAHFDHGIRSDSAKDRILVSSLAQKYGLEFEYSEGKLGSKASEATARDARYAFLQDVRKRHNAKAIITAHHRDDLIETAVLNLQRGTNRRGMTSLKSNDELVRPLLPYSKQELHDYALQHSLLWREDSTNDDMRYERNRIRQEVLAKLTDYQRSQIAERLGELDKINQELDAKLLEHLWKNHKRYELDRAKFVMLPHDVAREVIATWLRVNGITGYDKKSLERLVVHAKTLRTGAHFDVQSGVSIEVKQKHLALSGLDR